MAGWLDELEGRAGPLRAAAHRFCAACGVSPSARGVEAAQALGRAVDAFCHQPESGDPHEDDRFLETAGAYLGLLVLDAHGGPGHVSRDTRHRVLLGQHGCFDPFGAIDGALDAERPLHALADSLALAEAEARGEGPVASVVAALDAALSDAGLARRVVQRFELEVELDDGAQIDLRSLASRSTWPRNPRDAQQLTRDIERLVGMLPRPRATGDSSEAVARSPSEVAECLQRLLPRLVQASFTRGLPEGVALACAPLTQDILLAFAEQHSGRARFLRLDELASLGGAPCVLAAALENLRMRSSRMRFEPLHVGGVTWLAGKSGDGLDAARILLPEALTHARTLLPNVALAAIPHRDTILWAPANSEAALANYAEDLLHRAPHPISALPLPLPLPALSAWG